MTTITINGKTLDREFQNMAQALAFAYQNGECYGAKNVELAIDGKPSATGGDPITSVDSTPKTDNVDPAISGE